MLQEVCAQERGSVPCGRVFAHPVRVEKEPGADVILRMMSLGAEEVDKGRAPVRGKWSECLEVKLALSKRLEAAQRDDHGRSASRALLNGQSDLDVFRR